MRVWVLAEAFTLTSDGTTAHGHPKPWAGVYPDRETCMRKLRELVEDRVSENYAGRDDAGRDIATDVAGVLAGGRDFGVGRNSREYGYSASDREITWRVYPWAIEGRAK